MGRQPLSLILNARLCSTNPKSDVFSPTEYGRLILATRRPIRIQHSVQTKPRLPSAIPSETKTVIPDFLSESEDFARSVFVNVLAFVWEGLGLTDFLLDDLSGETLKEIQRYSVEDNLANLRVHEEGIFEDIELDESDIPMLNVAVEKMVSPPYIAKMARTHPAKTIKRHCLLRKGIHLLEITSHIQWKKKKGGPEGSSYDCNVLIVIVATDMVEGASMTLEKDMFGRFEDDDDDEIDDPTQRNDPSPNQYPEFISSAYESGILSIERGMKEMAFHSQKRRPKWMAGTHSWWPHDDPDDGTDYDTDDLEHPPKSDCSSPITRSKRDAVDDDDPTRRDDPPITGGRSPVLKPARFERDAVDDDDPTRRDDPPITGGRSPVLKPARFERIYPNLTDVSLFQDLPVLREMLSMPMNTSEQNSGP
eukprot:TRINITY_DN576_c0_g1_i13.p1 TRINITY_DN576_c0_g1~~TRINITY_DN576_c0_g1_i13.p1  ORF type:complete len:453 (+),score=103.34 TRINITY_DN576_c0_g1_i13:98-1360(+)